MHKLPMGISVVYFWRPGNKDGRRRIDPDRIVRFPVG